MTAGIGLHYFIIEYVLLFDLFPQSLTIELIHFNQTHYLNFPATLADRWQVSI